MGVQEVLTWWPVSSRAVHTNTPETPRANALVRKSWGAPCEPLSTRSICGPAATVGIAGGGLGGSQVADTRGAPAVFRNPDAFLISVSRKLFGPGLGGLASSGAAWLVIHWVMWPPVEAKLRVGARLVSGGLR